MLTPREVSGKIAELADARLSLYDFEKWFRGGSRNFHRWPDEKARDLVYEIESVLSDYHMDGLDESRIPQELANAIRPFEEPTEEPRLLGIWRNSAPPLPLIARTIDKSHVESIPPRSERL